MRTVHQKICEPPLHLYVSLQWSLSALCPQKQRQTVMVSLIWHKSIALTPMACPNNDRENSNLWLVPMSCLYFVLMSTCIVLRKVYLDSCFIWFTGLFNNMRTLKFKAQPTNAFFATVNQMFGGSSKLPTMLSEQCSTIWFDYRALGRCRKLGQTIEHLIDGSEKRICTVEICILESACYWKAQ